MAAAIAHLSVGPVLHMDSEQKWSLGTGLLFGALGVFVLSHLVYRYRNPLRLGKGGGGPPLSRSSIVLLGCSLLAFGVVAVANAFSPKIASAVLPWAVAAALILFISVLILDALKR